MIDTSGIAGAGTAGRSDTGRAEDTDMKAREIRVDIDNSLTLEELLRLGNYGNRISSKTETDEKTLKKIMERLEGIELGTSKKEIIYLVNIGYYVQKAKAASVLKESGYDPVNLRTLLSIGHQHQNEQVKWFILSLYNMKNGALGEIYLSGDKIYRNAGMFGTGDGIGEHSLFACHRIS